MIKRCNNFCCLPHLGNLPKHLSYHLYNGIYQTHFYHPFQLSTSLSWRVFVTLCCTSTNQVLPYDCADYNMLFAYYYVVITTYKNFAFRFMPKGTFFITKNNANLTLHFRMYTHVIVRKMQSECQP